MKRDMDIIRLLLLQLETGDRPSQLDNFSEERVTYNAALMVHAGLVKGAFARGGDGDSLGVGMDRMKWSGHDFLDAARDETLWKKAKQTVMKPAASFTFEIVREWLKNEIRARFGG